MINANKNLFLNKKMTILLLFFLLQTILLAQTSVWKVQKDEEIIYLGGTIHLLRAKDYPLPKEYDKAYENSDIIYFETDLNALNQPSVQQTIISKMTLKDGEKLKNLMSKETYEALKAHSISRGVDLKNYENFKPAMILLTLTIIELKNMGINTEGVDKFYLEKALKDKKELAHLESVEAHINYMADMGWGNEDKLIIQSLKDFKQIKKYFKRIISSWKSGSTQSLNKLFVLDMKKNFPKLYDSILLERNNNWMPIIESLFENDKTEFVLVGVAHLVGKDGLLKQLKKNGYKVKKLK